MALPSFRRLAAALTVVFIAAGNLFGDETTDPSARRDPDIDAMVREVSAASIESYIRMLAGFQTRHTLSETKSDDRGIGAARRWIKSQLEQISFETAGRLKVDFYTFKTRVATPTVPASTEIVNIVATLPGRIKGPDARTYVICAHYDSRTDIATDATSPAPGANNNGSGVAALLELARVMSSREFDATLVFLAVAAGEQDHQGSAHWAQTAVQNKVPIAGVFNTDTIGNTLSEDGTIDRDQVLLFAEGAPPLRTPSADTLAQLRSGGENDFPSRQLARLVKEVGERYVSSITVNIVHRRDRHRHAGDHGSFLDRGFPALLFAEPAEFTARQNQRVRIEEGMPLGDRPDFVDFGYIAQVTRVNGAALASLARSPAAPKDVQITAASANDTVLSWTPNASADLAGYRIVWRETTAPLWQGSEWIGRAESHTLVGKPLDIFIFGVQAIDLDGHASPAVYPRPGRADGK